MQSFGQVGSTDDSMTGLAILGSTGSIGRQTLEVVAEAPPRPPAPEIGMTTAYGEYLVNTGDCRSCHGAALTGAKSSEPGAPFSPNLTPGGMLRIWSTDDFLETIRTGATPYGRQLDANFMPYEEYARMTDEDLTAIFLYLQSLPAEETPSK